ncbi:hypothetical protein ACQWU4_06735 [Chryseobacterium sp. MIQD13]|uniref:hypothetical protein n=1 Tax=Chryseobacterium sp. MIQD13 TaxID=3422310 RepID=UPI003D2BB662
MGKFHGKVKSVKEYIAGVIQSETMYSPEGKVSEIKLYRKGILSSTEKRYEKDGMNIREIHRLGKTSPEMVLLHYSDSHGNRNKTEYYDPEKNFLDKKEFGETLVKYNSTGKLVSFVKDNVVLFQKQFNKKNQAVEELSFSDHGDIIYTVQYFYHKNTITRKSFDTERRLTNLRYLVLDEKNRVLQSFKFSRYDIKNDCINYYETYNTENKSRVTTEDLKNSIDNSLLETSDFPLDDTFACINEIKKLLNEFRFDMDGKELSGYPSINFFTEFTDVDYDHLDREISYKKYVYWPHFSKDQLTLLEYSIKKYNDRNLLIAHSYGKTEKNHDFGGSYEYTYEFDSENRTIKKITTGDSKSITRISYENGNRTEVQEKDDDDQKFTHIFDSHDNLIYYEDTSDKRNWKWYQTYEFTYY